MSARVIKDQNGFLRLKHQADAKPRADFKKVRCQPPDSQAGMLVRMSPGRRGCLYNRKDGRWVQTQFSNPRAKPLS